MMFGFSAGIVAPTVIIILLCTRPIKLTLLLHILLLLLTTTMPAVLHDLDHKDIHKAVKSLIHNLVNITDTTGKFLLTLPDGRVIDTKGWNNWE